MEIKEKQKEIEEDLVKNNFKIKEKLENITKILKLYPLTFIFTLIFSIMAILSLALVKNEMFSKIIIASIFPGFLFFAIESRYFNVKFENKKDAKSLKLWHYLFGITVSLIVGIVFITNFKESINTNLDVVNIVIHKTTIVLLYTFIISLISLFGLGLYRINKNIKLEKTDSIHFSYRKYLKLFLLVILFIIISAILKSIFLKIKILTYLEIEAIIKTFLYLILPIIILPLVLNILTNTKQYKSEVLKKFMIYFVAPFAILTTIISSVVKTIKGFDSTNPYIYLSYFIILAIIGVGLKTYFKKNNIQEDKNKDKKKNKNKNKANIKEKKETKVKKEKILNKDTKIILTKEDKYIKILSDLILLPLILLMFLYLYLIIKSEIYNNGIKLNDFWISIVFILEGLFIYLYSRKDHDLAKRYINCVNIFMLLGLIAFAIFSFTINTILFIK